MFNNSYYDTFNSLKKTLTAVPILMHWISNVQFIIKIDTSNYALAAILSIMNKIHKVYLVVFHFQIFTSMKLNYNTHGKKLLAIFEALKNW